MRVGLGIPIRREIQPIRVQVLDQLQLPVALPALDPLLAGDGGRHPRILLEPDQSGAAGWADGSYVASALPEKRLSKRLTAIGSRHAGVMQGEFGESMGMMYMSAIKTESPR